MRARGCSRNTICRWPGGITRRGCEARRCGTARNTRDGCDDATTSKACPARRASRLLLESRFGRLACGRRAIAFNLPEPASWLNIAGWTNGNPLYDSCSPAILGQKPRSRFRCGCPVRRPSARSVPLSKPAYRMLQYRIRGRSQRGLFSGSIRHGGFGEFLYGQCKDHFCRPG